MELVTPAYYPKFKCIADKCTDNCCIGWEIDIDEYTSDLYKKTDGEFGNRLKSSIYNGPPDTFILNDNQRCPFLNKNNLCDIITTLGKNSLCQICRDHPRFFEWYNDIKEGGIGLCCEEASRLILTDKDHSFVAEKIAFESCDAYDIDLYRCLYNARSIIMNHLCSDKIPLEKRICDILDYCEHLQYLTDNNNFSVPEIISSVQPGHSDIRPVLKFLGQLEPINNKWPEYISCIINMYDKVNNLTFNQQDKIISDSYLQNIMLYFVWRYFLKGVFDGEFLSRIKLAAVSTAVISYMFSCLQTSGTFSLNNCAQAAKDYSKEIEYSEENINIFQDSTYEIEIFTTEKIKGLFF